MYIWSTEYRVLCFVLSLAHVRYLGLATVALVSFLLCPSPFSFRSELLLSILESIIVHASLHLPHSTPDSARY